MITADVWKELTSILPADHVQEQKTAETRYGNDGQVLVFPRTEEEIAAILTFASTAEKKVNVCGCGSKRGLGGTEDTADILLSTASFRGIKEHSVGDMTIFVKPGTPFRELQDYLASHGQKLPIDPIHAENATIGGVIAANESGPKRLAYGSARDLVIGLRVAYANGEIIRTGGKVVKNVAGYDMNKLFVGSMGTLGVITEIGLKLRPLPEHESLVLLSFPEGDIDDIQAFSEKLMKSRMEPVSLELLTPALAETLTGDASFTLAAALEDVASSVFYQEDYIRNIQPANARLSILNVEEAGAFWERFQHTFALDTSEQHQGTEVLVKIGVQHSDVLEVLKEGEREALCEGGHGGMGHGLCQLHLKGDKKQLADSISSLREAVEEKGGYLVVQHASLALRREVSVWGEPPAHFFLMEGIKTKIDPQRTLNPKRFVGGL
ncbi:FAD-binding oxidoreductase [Salibacterium aidingense]|uniref:FAD-binding oxidoreductase n=1 Tax=Salibacterium aidingense TaxID=384933 RepID=UPI000412E005|nr:FAD-binding oxidoreductase [Salibacterium aidingense]